MKTYFFSFVILLLLVSNCHAAEPQKWNSNLTVEQNIVANVISLKDSADLSFLDEISKEKSIILLGESGHYELKTSEAKINMINYLKKKNGFNAVALETVSFLSAYVFSNPEYNKQTKDWKFEYFWAQVWTDQKTCQPLIEQIQQRKIKVLGIDGQLGMFDVSSAQILLEKYKKDFPLDIKWSKFYNYYLARLVFYMSPQYYKPLTKAEEFQLMSMINKVSNYVRYIIYKKGDAMDLKAIMQWIINVKNAFPYTKYDALAHGLNNKIDTTLLVDNEKNRDEMMAKNIMWHINNIPKEKFTVWCANYHESKEISQIIYTSDSLCYFRTQTMGEFLNNSSVGNKVYSLAITSKNVYQGEEDGTLESEIRQTTRNAPFAFIDFISLRFKDGYWDKTFNTNFMKRKDGKWLFSFDGVYYLRDQKLNYK